MSRARPKQKLTRARLNWLRLYLNVDVLPRGKARGLYDFVDCSPEP